MAIEWVGEWQFIRTMSVGRVCWVVVAVAGCGWLRRREC